jgi:hypothetical protein
VEDQAVFDIDDKYNSEVYGDDIGQNKTQPGRRSQPDVHTGHQEEYQYQSGSQTTIPPARFAGP